MSGSSSCRLCFSSENGHRVNIFSDIGIDMKMSEIISEHFKCDVNKLYEIIIKLIFSKKKNTLFCHHLQISELDSLPNFVCQPCWQTTEAFHELYQKSKAVQEKFLNPMIKIEIDTTGLWHENTERDFIDDPQYDINAIKLEPNLGSYLFVNLFKKEK